MIWDTVRDSAWEIYYILQMLFQASLKDIVAKMRREKAPGILSKFAKTPVLPITSFVPIQLDILGQAVKDNILYYDPVEGVYWGGSNKIF